MFLNEVIVQTENNKLKVFNFCIIIIFIRFSISQNELYFFILLLTIYVAFIYS